MIECVEEKVIKKKNRKKKSRFFSFLKLFIIILLISLYFNFVVEDLIIKVVCDYSYRLESECVNYSVGQSVNNDVNYSDIVLIEKNKEGDIVFIDKNTQKLNEIGRNIAINTQNLLKLSIDKGVPVPILAFTGIKFLTGYGKSINFKSISISDVTCDFLSEFKSVGINQTLNSVYAEITCSVKISFPLKSREASLSTKVLLCEAVIVGKVPEIYFNK